MTDRRPTSLCRSWLFVPGADARALEDAGASGADVLIQELEDFTPPDLRPRARELAAATIDAWRQAGCVTAVRINPLSGDGMADLSAVMASGPDIIALPKVDEGEDIERLSMHVGALEEAHGLPRGATELLPNIESARGLLALAEIAKASSRIKACLIASEDMAADLGAVREPGGGELDYVRQRFLVECVAAGVMAIDYPYTWADAAGCEAETVAARQLGFKAKSGVALSHAAVINRALTPSEVEIREARRIISAFEAAQAAGEGRAELDGNLVEVPTVMNARRLLRRAGSLAAGTEAGDDSEA